MRNRSLITTPPGHFEWVDIPVPQPGPEEVVIRSRFGTIKHGTEFSMVKGTASDRGPWDRKLQLHKSPEGHEGFENSGKSAGQDVPTRSFKSQGQAFSVGNMIYGEIVSTGEAVRDFQIGDLVYGYSPFAHYAAVSQNRIWKLPDVDWRTALCLDPARFALAAVRDAQLRIGDSLAVFGLGAIGLLCVQLARMAGADGIIGIDPIPARRAAALRMGASLCLDPAAPSSFVLPQGSAESETKSEGDTGRSMKIYTGGLGVDAVIELSGAATALQAALRGVAFGGTVVCAAFPAPYPAGLDFGAEAHMNRPQIVFSRAVSDPNRDHPRWDSGRLEKYCRSLIAEEKLEGTGIIDKVVAYDTLKEEYRQAMDSPSTVIKLGVDFENGS